MKKAEKVNIGEYQVILRSGRNGPPVVSYAPVSNVLDFVFRPVIRGTKPRLIKRKYEDFEIVHNRDGIYQFRVSNAHKRLHELHKVLKEISEWEVTIKEMRAKAKKRS